MRLFSQIISLMIFQCALAKFFYILWVEATADADHPVMESDFTGIYIRLIALMLAGIGIEFFAQASKLEGRA